MDNIKKINVKDLLVTPQDEDNTYIGIDENGELVRTKIELSGNSNVTSDWNAQKGEDGFIENKPFKVIRGYGDEIVLNHPLKKEDFIETIDDNGIHYFKKSLSLDYSVEQVIYNRQFNGYGYLFNSALYPLEKVNKFGVCCCRMDDWFDVYTENLSDDYNDEFNLVIRVNYSIDGEIYFPEGDIYVFLDEDGPISIEKIGSEQIPNTIARKSEVDNEVGELWNESIALWDNVERIDRTLGDINNILESI